MHTDPNQFRPIDPGRVNATEPLEMQYWCAELGCTEPELRVAVTAVGEHVTAVREHLRAHR